MKTFQLQPDAFKAFRNKILIMAIPLSLLAAFAGVLISVLNDKDGSGISILPIMIPVILLVVGVRIALSLKRQKKMWASYRLIIDGDTITRSQDGAPAITIDKKDLRSILQLSNGSITLKTDRWNIFITIPAGIANREELLDQLGTFAPVVNKTGNPLLPVLSAVGALVLMGLVFVPTEKIIVIPAGILLVVGLLWAFVSIQRTKIVDVRTKRGSYIMFLLIAAIIARMLMI